MQQLKPWTDGSLHTACVRELRTRKVVQVAADTQLPLYWLTALRQGRISDPGVNRMQHLYEHLFRRPLL